MKIGIMGIGKIGWDIYRLAAEQDNLAVTAVSDLANPAVFVLPGSMRIIRTN